MTVITSIEQLEALYGTPSEASIAKEAPVITPHYRAFIDASPFVTLATTGPDGVECSPRGDRAGFARVHDERTLMLPDRRGNNRVDSLRNIVLDPRVGLLFLIPGSGTTLRVNGRAHLDTDPTLLASFEMDGKPPRSVIVVAIEKVFFQCARALVRSRLWSPEAQIPRSALPSTGTILATLSRDAIDGRAYDAELPQRIRQTLY